MESSKNITNIFSTLCIEFIVVSTIKQIGVKTNRTLFLVYAEIVADLHNTVVSKQKFVGAKKK
jgi:hypothetical protein